MTDRWTPEQYRERADQHFAEAQRLRGRAAAFRDTGHKQVASFELAKTWGFAHSAASLFIIADRYDAEAKVEEDKGVNLEEIATRRAFEREVEATAAAHEADIAPYLRPEREPKPIWRFDTDSQRIVLAGDPAAKPARKPWWRCW